MKVKFAAQMNVNAMANYVNPKTGQPDKMSERLAYATIPLFNDELTRFVLENTRDEVVVTPRRVQYRSRSGRGTTEAMNFTIQIRGIPGYTDTMGMTYGFNPFVQTGKKGRMQGALQAKDRILNEIVARHQAAARHLLQVNAGAPKHTP